MGADLSPIYPSGLSTRPTVSDADEWSLWLQDNAHAAPAYIAVQIVEAIEEHQKALAREVYGLREQTDSECEGVARLDLEGKQGAFARGRMYEAKGIARSINAIMPYSRDPMALAHGGRERLANQQPLAGWADWQPIKTAPKSTTTPAPGGHHVRGVYLLGFCPEEGATPESCISVIWWEPHHHGENRGAWVSEAGFEVEPTKWTRLPAPPVAGVAA